MTTVCSRVQEHLDYHVRYWKHIFAITGNGHAKSMHDMYKKSYMSVRLIHKEMAGDCVRFKNKYLRKNGKARAIRKVQRFRPA